MRITGKPAFAAILGFALLASGCGKGNDHYRGETAGQPSVTPSTIDVSKAGRCDFLDQSVCLYPFPNDYFTRADANTPTGLRVHFQQKSMPADKNGRHINPEPWNHSDGFSPGQQLITKVPGLGTPGALAATGAPTVNHIGISLQPDSPVVVIDTDTGKRWPVWAEVDQAASLDSNNNLAGPPPKPKDAALLIYPAKNFTEGDHYVVALRNLKKADGTPIKASPAFQVYRDDVSSNIPAIEKRRAHMQEIFRELQDAGIARDNLYLAWDFTVASRKNITGRELNIRNRAFADLGDTNLADGQIQGAAPTFHIDNNGVTNFAPCTASNLGDCPAGTSKRLLRRVEGTITVPCYLDQSGCPAGARFQYQGAAKNQPKRIPGNVIKAKFICNIPRSVKDQSGAVHPTRLSLYGHGLFGSPSEVNAGNVQDMAFEHNITYCATSWIGMASGDVPNTIGILKNLSRFPELVDRTEQSMVDFMYLGRAMIHAQGFVSNPAFQVQNASNQLVPAIDTSHLYYDGNSQGGIFGGTLMTLEPDITRGVLGVPAINYSVLLPRSVDFAPFAAVLYPLYPNRLDRPLVLNLLQMLWDRSDPDGYAQFMTDNPLPDTPAHKVLLQPAWGDHQVTDWAVAVEARTIGAHRHAPTVASQRLNEPDGNPFFGIAPIQNYPYAGSAAIVFWDSGPIRDNGNKGTPPPPLSNIPNNAGNDPHSLPRKDAVARKQKSKFLQSNGKVYNVCGNSPCYDDGYTGP